ncbi:MAG: hypothetical protein A3F70_14205 [Acidobacteria bacterium RIFCSPLOWO2_12_FULL_67_14]|nr:MAG: hypothetical protein A3H29_11275 [Acidobacteria bacterium RIFCSPLOWO2_02_FULL_67_21]OFW39677.1 MAG: hypothetical protein A3F70_14205 [Acidobacteria bacterium RIFCSPLOWO2_12_FULL_67_14]
MNIRRIIGTAAALVIVAAGVASAQSQAQVDEGQEVFTAQKCSICHSVAGKGNAKGVLDGVGSKLSADEIRQWITDAPAMAAKVKAERKPPMKAFTSLPKDQLDALVAYVQSLKK